MESSRSRFERRVELGCGRWALSGLCTGRISFPQLRCARLWGEEVWGGGRIQALCILFALCGGVSHPRALSRRRLGGQAIDLRGEEWIR